MIVFFLVGRMIPRIFNHVPFIYFFLLKRILSFDRVVYRTYLEKSNCFGSLTVSIIL